MIDFLNFVIAFLLNIKELFCFFYLLFFKILVKAQVIFA